MTAGSATPVHDERLLRKSLLVSATYIAYDWRMVKKTKPTKRKPFPPIYVLLLIALALALLARVIGWPVYQALTTEKVAIPVSKSRLAYVDGNEATDQVANFYRQYIKPGATPAFQKFLIKGYGTNNLLFYSEYYQYGFDPITCSTTMPIKVTAALVSTGPVATVKAIAEYPDRSKANIVARVVIDDQGLNIDSITCPGAKGNLAPGRAL